MSKSHQKSEIQEIVRMLGEFLTNHGSSLQNSLSLFVDFLGPNVLKWG